MAWGEVPCTYRGSTDSALISLGISKFRNLLEAYKLNTCFKGVITVITISLQSVNLLVASNCMTTIQVECLIEEIQ